MMIGSSCPALPYTPRYFPGELLSSWLRRIAAEYSVDLPHLARHLGLSVGQARQIDHELPADDLRRVAIALRSEPSEIRKMVHSAQIQALLPTSTPLQVCLPCRAKHRTATPLPVAIRAWFEFWHIECGNCGGPFSPPSAARLNRCNPAREEPIWFESLRPAARAGARRLAEFAQRPFKAGCSPVNILRLLSMRFDAIRFASTPTTCYVAAELFATRRLAELFVPGLADRWHANLLPEPWTEDQPVRLVTARTILLAGLTALLEDRDRAVRLLTRATAHVRHRDFTPLLSSLSVNAARQ
jgi:TniQ